MVDIMTFEPPPSTKVSWGDVIDTVIAAQNFMLTNLCIANVGICINDERREVEGLMIMYYMRHLNDSA